MLRTLSVSDCTGSARRLTFCTSATIWIPPIVAVVFACSGPASAEPLNTPPVASDEHGRFYKLLDLLDPATLALPPLPAGAPATPSKPNVDATATPPTVPGSESWVWELEADGLPLPRQGPPPVREVPRTSRWGRLVARATPVALAAGAVIVLAVLAVLAVLVSLAQRR